MALLLSLAACAVIDMARGRDRTDEHDMSALMRAAAAGDSVEVERLIARGANVNQTVRPHHPLRELIAFLSWMQQLPRRDDGYSALHYALQEGQLGIARALLARAATPAAYEDMLWFLAYRHGTEGLRVLLDSGLSPASEHGGSIMTMIAAARDTAALALMLRAGANPDGSGEATPLMQVAREGDTLLVRLLLEAGARRDAREPRTGWTPAMIARDAGHDEVADMIGGPEDRNALLEAELARAVQSSDSAEIGRLLAQGVSANARTTTGDPILSIAIGRREHALVSRLLDVGADPHANTIVGPLIMEAVQTGDSAIVAVLLAAGANARAPGLASMAASIGSVPVLRMLAAAGADLRERNDEPLRMAAAANRLDAVLLLLERGANVRAADQEGRSPLLRTSDVELARVLLDAGADPNQAMGNWTPLMSAAISGDSARVELLLERGADRMARDDEGRTAGEIARRAGHTRIAERLGK